MGLFEYKLPPFIVPPRIQVVPMDEIIFVAPLNPHCPRGPIEKIVLPELQKIRFRGLLKNHLRVTAREHYLDRQHGVRLQFDLATYDVVTNESIKVGKESIIDQSVFDRQIPIDYWFYEQLKSLLWHELSESFVFDGKPHVEPHPELRGLSREVEKIDRELIELYEQGKNK